MRITVTVPPTVFPLTVYNAAAQLRVDPHIDTNAIQSYIFAAVEAFERETGRALIERTLAVTYFEDEAKRHLQLPIIPATAVLSITDKNGNTIDPSGYELRRYGNMDSIRMITSPSYPITVTYNAGQPYAPPSNQTLVRGLGFLPPIPGDIFQALLAHIAYMYEYRQSDAPDPAQLETIYARYRQAGGIVG